MANNLAKLSILALVALSGYDMQLHLDPNDPLNLALKSSNSTPRNGPSAISTSSSSSSPGTHNLKNNAPSQNSTATNTASSLSSSPSSYTTNATNIIQNSLHLVQGSTAAATESKGNFKSYVNILDNNGTSKNGLESNNSVDKSSSALSTPVEKQNTASNKKYSISGTAKNLIVKHILENLLTQFVANKLASDSEYEVSIVFNSNEIRFLTLF